MRILILLMLLAVNVFAQEEKILNVYSWSEVLPDWVFREFEEKTGVRVNHSSYSSNEALYAKLKVNPDADYDIIMPSTYFVERMIKQNMLQKIDNSKLNTTRRDLFFPVDTDYSVPYFWVATGIGINRHYHPNVVLNGWLDLWETSYYDRLLLLDDARENFSIALLTLGYSVNSQSEKELHLAFERLKSLMKNIRLFNSDSQKAIYLDEEITLGAAWNGDVFSINQKNPDVDFIYPEEGFVVSIDSFAIPRSAKHVGNAHQFIDFMLTQAISERVSLEVGFSLMDRNRVRGLPKAIRKNPILYPSDTVMKRARFQKDVGDMIPVYERYFEQLKLEN